MQVLNSLDYLFEVLFTVLLVYNSFAFYQLIQGALLSELHHEVDFLRVVKNAVKFDDVLMIEGGEDFYFVLKLTEQSLLP